MIGKYKSFISIFKDLFDTYFPMMKKKIHKEQSRDMQVDDTETHRKRPTGEEVLQLQHRSNLYNATSPIYQKYKNRKIRLLQ